VDDEQEFVQTLSERLRMRDVPSHAVYSGEEALGLLEEETPEVMVLDLKMPGVDGFEILAKVKKTNPDIEVIILTGHGTENDRQRCMEMGAFAYLQKPTDIDLLTTTMKKAYARIREKRNLSL
jgi:DNA-binding NtrC family response regulator